MKNNTNIRLHVSKALFATIAKEVLAEAKINGGGAYTQAVKMPKQAKQVKEVDAMADTDKMEKMEEKMSSKEKMAKGLYKEDDMEEMQVNVAEDDMLNEMDPAAVTDLLSVLAGMGGIALGGLGIVKWQDRIKAKNPELYKKLQSVSSAIKKADPSKDLSEKSVSLNELRKQAKNK